MRKYISERMRPFVGFYFLTFLTLLIAGFAQAQPVAGLVPERNEKGVWGYKKADGRKFEVKPRFTEARSFVTLSKGAGEEAAFAIVGVRGKKDPADRYGIIGADGEFLVKPVYSEIKDFLRISPDTLQAIVTVGDGAAARYGVLELIGMKGIAMFKTMLEPEYRFVAFVGNGGPRDYYVCEREGRMRGIRMCRRDYAIPCEYTSLTNMGDFMIASTGGGHRIFDLSEDPRFPQYATKGTMGVEYSGIYILRKGYEAPMELRRSQLYEKLRKPADTYFLALAKHSQGGELYSLINARGDIKADSIRKIESFGKELPDVWFITDKRGDRRLFTLDMAQGDVRPIPGLHAIGSVETMERLHGDDYLLNGAHIYNMAARRLLLKVDGLHRENDNYLCLTGGSRLINSIYKTDGQGRLWRDKEYDVFESGRPLEDFSTVCYSQRLFRLEDVSGSEVETEEEDGNIYTNPAFLRGRTGVCFMHRMYSRVDKPLPRDLNAYYGRMISAVMIEGKVENIDRMFTNLDYNRLLRFEPILYWIRDDGKYLLFYSALYESETISLENRVRYISLIDPWRMRVEKSVALKGMDDYCSFRFHGKNTYCYQRRRQVMDDKSVDILGDNASSIILLDGGLSVESVIAFEEGEYVTDFIEHDGKLLLCGATENKGYIGYNNPLLKLYDTSTRQTLDLSSLLPRRKGSYIRRIVSLDGGALTVEMEDGSRREIKAL